MGVLLGKGTSGVQWFVRIDATPNASALGKNRKAACSYKLQWSVEKSFAAGITRLTGKRRMPERGENDGSREWL
jgi:hypothetical protein